MRHLGPTAQDFFRLFGGLGEDERHISTVDADGVALAAAQGLQAVVARQADSLAALAATVAAQQAALAAQRAELAEVAALRSRLAATEAAVAKLLAAKSE